MSKASQTTLYTSALNLPSLNTAGNLLTLSVLNCGSKVITGTFSFLDRNGASIFLTDEFTIEPGKIYDNGYTGFGKQQANNFVVYGKITLTTGKVSDVRASLSIIDNAGYTIILAEAR